MNMNKIYLSLMAVAVLAFVACGDGSKNKPGTEAPATDEPVAEATTEEVTEAPEAEGTMTFENFSAQLSEACGVSPITNDKMTKIIVRKDKENEFFMASPVTDDIDKEAVQREYFNSFAKVADGNKIYGINMNGSRGTDTFKDYDEYVKFIKANGQYNKVNYTYDYKGKPIDVYCSVSFGDFGLTVTLK